MTLMNGINLVICDDLSASELRKRGRQETDRAAAARMVAITNSLEGMTRAEAARLAGMERQALRDAVLRYNAEGVDGLYDRLVPGAKPRLDDGQMAQLRQIVVAGPDMEKTGLLAWTLAELCGEVKRR
jgi:transposase